MAISVNYLTRLLEDLMEVTGVSKGTYKGAVAELDALQVDTVIVSDTTANISDKTHALNTVDKVVGKGVYDTDKGSWWYADAATDVGTWSDALGANPVTPS